MQSIFVNNLCNYYSKNVALGMHIVLSLIHPHISNPSTCDITLELNFGKPQRNHIDWADQIMLLVTNFCIAVGNKALLFKFSLLGSWPPCMFTRLSKHLLCCPFVFKHLNNAMLRRMSYIKEKRKIMASNTSQFFTQHLSQRGFSGHITFDHSREVLELIVSKCCYMKVRLH